MTMSEKFNLDVWVVLLSLCRLYGELEMVSIVVDEFFKLCVNGRFGFYVGLLNVLVVFGRWDCVNEVRELMK